MSRYVSVKEDLKADVITEIAAKIGTLVGADNYAARSRNRTRIGMDGVEVLLISVDPVVEVVPEAGVLEDER